MDNTDRPNPVSKYRTELMGIAILWVFLFHTKIYFPDSAIFLPLKFIKDVGDGGVDLFIFLSGFGLMYGMQKFSYSPAVFYRRRILRIAPAYLLTVILTLLVKKYLGSDVSLSEVFLKISATWFWVGKGTFLWYISVIIVLYMIFPLYYTLFIKSSNKKLFTFVFMLIFYAASVLITIFHIEHYHLFLMRVPVFFFGIYVGYNSFVSPNKAKSNMFHFCILFFSFLILALIMANTNKEIQRETGIHLYTFILISYSMIFLTSQFMSTMEDKKNKLVSTLLKLLNLAGIYSFEIYLLHENVIFPLGRKITAETLHSNIFLNQLNRGRILEFFIYFIATVFFAKILKLTYSTIFPVQPSRSHSITEAR